MTMHREVGAGLWTRTGGELAVQRHRGAADRHAMPRPWPPQCQAAQIIAEQDMHRAP
jgi:hypothetical protein